MPSIAAGFKSFVATRIQNASGGPLAAGTLGVVPTDENDDPTSAIAGGVGGAITYNEDQMPVVGGAITGFVVADTEAATPPIFYRIVIRQADGTPIFILKGVRTLDTVFYLDAYDPFTEHSTPPTGGGAPDLIFASPDSNLWQLARVSGALTAVPYSGSLVAQTLYLTDTDGSGNVYQVTIGNGGAITWTLVSGETGIASVAFIDYVTLVAATLTITGGAPTWT